eukprot:symbB.v1.2.025833.t1/scaffold2535.1/size76746/3
MVSTRVALGTSSSDKGRSGLSTPNYHRVRSRQGRDLDKPGDPKKKQHVKHVGREYVWAHGYLLHCFRTCLCFPRISHSGL